MHISGARGATRTYRPSDYDMAARHQLSALIQTPDLSLSDSEDSYSSTEEEMPGRDETDHLLRQAHHYVITEGGNDSPATFMKRIQRINQNLILEISRHSYDCDPKLYRRVKQKVDHVLREFEDAVDADSSIYSYDEMSEYYTEVAPEALYRTNSNPVTPDSLKKGSESWHKSAAASLPSPDTVRIADCESLRIHWDVANTSHVAKNESDMSNGGALTRPRLAHNEPGSHFKLSAIEQTRMAKVNQFETVLGSHKAVDAFIRCCDNEVEGADHKDAPHVLPGRFAIDRQDIPQDLIIEVRKAVNATPTRSRTSSSSTGSSNITSTLPTDRTSLSKPQQALTLGSAENDSSHTIRIDFSRKSAITLSPPLETTVPEALFRNDDNVSPAIRRIKAATEASIHSSSLPQSPPSQPETDPTRQVAHATSQTKRVGPHPQRQLRRETTHTTTSAHPTIVTGKRKRLSVDTASAAAERLEDVDEVPAKRTRITRSCTLLKNVSEALRRIPSHFRPCTPVTAFLPEGLPTPALTPASSAVSTPPVSKARGAGKQRRIIRTKRDFETRASPEKYAEIMAGRRGESARGHEGSAARAHTRKGNPRAA